MNLQIVPINDQYYEDAVRIAVEGKTGLEKDVRPRLKKHERFYVALSEGKVVGEIGWYTDDGGFAGKAIGKNFPYGEGVYWINHYAVDLNYRNRGIGAALLKHLENELKKLGAKELWVYTDMARGYYEKHGFTFVQEAFIDPAFEEDILKKELE